MCGAIDQRSLVVTTAVKVVVVLVETLCDHRRHLAETFVVTACC